mmetsp:Transcript_61561/g.179920  ORF Transcript_61561/g.179920 Transcript_61561/m.179920 type:complete len:219 (+) Transcript_61561:97-753(+)
MPAVSEPTKLHRHQGRQSLGILQRISRRSPPVHSTGSFTLTGTWRSQYCIFTRARRISWLGPAAEELGPLETESRSEARLPPVVVLRSPLAVLGTEDIVWLFPSRLEDVMVRGPDPPVSPSPAQSRRIWSPRTAPTRPSPQSTRRGFSPATTPTAPGRTLKAEPILLAGMGTPPFFHFSFSLATTVTPARKTGRGAKLPRAGSTKVAFAAFSASSCLL